MRPRRSRRSTSYSSVTVGDRARAGRRLAVSAVTDPPLTVLAQPVEEMATAAMTLLLECLGGRDETRKLVLPLEFRAPESS
jgi:DNA-binding LacI/PurR family transcriptional regulator